MAVYLSPGIEGGGTPHSPPCCSALRQSPKPRASTQLPAMLAPGRIPEFPVPPPRQHRGRIRLRMGGDNSRTQRPGSAGGEVGHKHLCQSMAVGGRRMKKKGALK